MKILLVGDTHGHPYLPELISKHAVSTGHDLIIQVGDFGYGWRGKVHGGVYVDDWARAVSQAADDHKIDWSFIDGNHDNHPKLWQDLGNGWSPRLTYHKRGDVANIGGTVFGFLGGGVSIDKKWRKVGKSWWDTETITDEQLNRAIANFRANNVDIIVSHDAPLAFPALKHGLDDADSPWPLEQINESRNHRRRLEKVLMECQPVMWVHGHFHYAYDFMFKNPLNGVTTSVHGLAQADRGGYTKDDNYRSCFADPQDIADSTLSLDA